MRPIDKRHFGAKYGSLVVKFHNGESIVSGIIKRQVGSTRYEVTDGIVTKVCDLARTTDEASALEGNKMTIETSDGQFINKLTAFQAITTESELINWKHPDAEVSIPVYEAPEVVAPAVAFNQTTRFIKSADRIYHGSGNRGDGMTLAFNGEIEVAGAVRHVGGGTNFATSLITPTDNVYSTDLSVAAGREWTYVYSFGLVGAPTGAVLTDMYDISVTLSRPEGGLTFNLARHGSAYHFHLNDLEEAIIDDTQALNGSLYQGIQRAKYYARFFDKGVVPVSATGAFLGETEITLKATPKGNRDFAPVEVKLIANITG